MNIHEYQAKELFREAGIPVPRGVPIFHLTEIDELKNILSGHQTAVKAQIYAGGRGKAGGVRLAKNFEEMKGYAANLLGATLVTHQTGPKGRLVQRLYIEEASNIQREMYLGMLVDRDHSCITIIAAAEGGMEIEELAQTNPEAICKILIKPSIGLCAHHLQKITQFLKLSDESAKQAHSIIKKLYKLFVEKDASTIEINPLILTPAGDLMALDAKMVFDDNALYRHPDIQALYDENEYEPSEIEASKYDLNFVKLDGNIGCMVNGAGLAIATMDIIKLYGGEPANFLDVGGGATREKVTEAFKIILSDSSIKGILVNIFGGIMRCDIIAEGIVEAAKEMQIKVPLVVRLAGTNVDLGRKILDESGLKITSADTLADAAEKIVHLTRG